MSLVIFPQITSACLSQQHSMVEASSSLAKLLLTQNVFAFGHNILQVLLPSYQARKANVFVLMTIVLIGLFTGMLSGCYWHAKRSTVSLLNLFLYLTVLMIPLNLLRDSLPAGPGEFLLQFLTGMLIEISSFPGIKNTIKTRLWGFKLTSIVPPLGICLTMTIGPMPAIFVASILPGTVLAAYCAFFTSIILYQLKSRSISDYAQEIDAIAEALRIENESKF